MRLDSTNNVEATHYLVFAGSSSDTKDFIIIFGILDPSDNFL